jgi:hypothetical protein
MAWRTYKTPVTWLCVAVCLISAAINTQEMVLCIGNNHVAVEAAVNGKCVPDTYDAPDVPGRNPSSLGTSDQTHCGPCVDMPLTGCDSGVPAARAHTLLAKSLPCSDVATVRPAVAQPAQTAARQARDSLDPVLPLVETTFLRL